MMRKKNSKRRSKTSKSIVLLDHREEDTNKIREAKIREQDAQI